MDASLQALRDDISGRAKGRAADVLARSVGDEQIAFARSVVNRVASGDLTPEAVLVAWDAAQGDGLTNQGAAFNAALAVEVNRLADAARARAEKSERRARARAERDAMPVDIDSELDCYAVEALSRLADRGPTLRGSDYVHHVDSRIANPLWRRHLVEFQEQSDGSVLVEITSHGRAALERHYRERADCRERDRRDALLALAAGPQTDAGTKYRHASSFCDLVRSGMAKKYGDHYRLTNAGRAALSAEPLSLSA